MTDANLRQKVKRYQQEELIMRTVKALSLTNQKLITRLSFQKVIYLKSSVHKVKNVCTKKRNIKALTHAVQKLISMLNFLKIGRDSKVMQVHL